MPWYEPGMPAGRLEPFVRGVDEEEQRAGRSVKASSDVEAASRPSRDSSGNQQQAERDREHADVEADQREQRRDARASARGVSTATAISCSNAVPVDVRSRTRCASPATQG